MTEAVITSVGVVSPFGVGTRAFWKGLRDGAGAVGPISCFDARGFPVKVAGQVPVEAPNADWIRNALREMCTDHPDAAAVETLPFDDVSWRDRKAAFGVLAALEAWWGAGLSAGHPKAWLSLALGLEQAHLQDFGPLWTGAGIDWRKDVPSLPAERFRSPVDRCASSLVRLLPGLGPVVVHTSACAAGALAVAHAAALIERGLADVVLCGGADSMINPLGLGGMERLGAPSPRPSADACRPFDIDRDGLVVGEGAAMFVVESERHARSRGARRLARIAGWGSTQDGYRATAPRPDGAAAARAITAALRRAGLSPVAIQYINAHGTGTRLNDVAETRALHLALRDRAGAVPVSSIKGAVGHLMAAAGAVELAACLSCFDRDLLPGTCNHGRRDPECNLDVIGPEPRPARVDCVLSNSFGFGGQNASVILQRCP